MLLHYGERGVTEACIESIRRLGYACDHEILVVDNDPEPSSWDEAGVAHVVTTHNVGFSAANNAGYTYARDVLKADMVIACNNDLVFSAGEFPESVLASYAASDVCVVSPDIVKVGTGVHQSPIDTRLRTREEASRTIRLNKLALAVYPLAYPFLRSQLKGQTQTAADVPAGTEDIVPCGACIIFTKKFIDAETELFTPATEFYYEEYILAARCRKNGYRIVYDPALRVGHIDAAATSSASAGDYARIRRKMRLITASAEVYLSQID